MEKIINYISENFDNYLNELKQFLSIPSISALPERSKDVKKAAEFVADKLKQAGLSHVEIFNTEGHPLVYGEWLGAPGKPTVLVYGHYDVQPVDPLELWNSPPFEPVIKNGKIWGRGTTDDKGQLYIHIKSVEAYFKNNGSLPVNVKFLIEGEEETGSESLVSFLHLNKDMLKCDAVLISDTSLYSAGTPTLTYGLRGIQYMEIEVTGPKFDLHSGTYGGAVDNPINVLATMIGKLHDKNGRVTIPNFYKDVLKVSKKEKENFKRLKFNEKIYMNEIGVQGLDGEAGYSVLERTWIRPTLDCNGIWGGFTGTGAKTVIPSKASAKISMRLVPNQEPKKIAKLFSNYIREIAPKSVKVTIKNMQGGHPLLISLDDKVTIVAAKALEKAFKKRTVFMRDGGSIPILVDFVKIFKAPLVLMGVGLDNENAHSPNEHLDLKHFKLGILSSAYFFDLLSRTELRE